MSTVAERPGARKAQTDRREVAFVVRAKTGPGTKDWNNIGVAFARKNGEPGFTIKLNVLPIDKNWNGSLVLVPPYEEDTPEEDQT